MQLLETKKNELLRNFEQKNKENKRYRSIHSPTNKWSKTEETQLLYKIRKTPKIKGKRKKIDWQSMCSFFPNRTKEAIRSKYMQLCRKEKKNPLKIISEKKLILKPRYSKEEKTFILRNVPFLGYARVGELMGFKRTRKAIKWAYTRFSSPIL